MALLQLAAQGQQDAMLTGEPSHSFFRSVYRKPTPFATEFRDQVFAGNAGWGKRAVVTVSRLGDLVHTCLLQATFKKTGATFYPIEALVTNVELQIGGIKIDSMDGTWFRVFDELYRDEDQRQAYREMADFSSDQVGTTKTLLLPLLFFFNRSMSHALPLIALSLQEVDIIFTFADSVDGVDMSVEPNPRLVCEYIYLSPTERRLMASTRHTFLIEQLQTIRSPIEVKTEETQRRVDLNFNHPCKALVWTFVHPSKHGVFTGSGEGLEYSELCGPMKTAKLLVNNLERCEARPGSWYRIVDSFARNRQIPSVGIYSINFCLGPGDCTKPSGSLNLSRVDAALHLTTKKVVPGATRVSVLDEDSETIPGAAALDTVRIYAQTWNQLLLHNGMAGLRWTN